MLHELANRSGHTALLIGGVSVPGDELARLDNAIGAGSKSPIVETMFVLITRTDNRTPSMRIAPSAAEQLGIDGITLLVIRPDGHVGLRADRNHVQALAAYQTRLVWGRP